MHDMLRTIIENQRVKVAARKRACPTATLFNGLERHDTPRALQRALQESRKVHIIAEIKRASPSAGLLRPGFDPAAIAQSYERHGAAAVSVLTEEDFFLGRLDHLRAVRQAVRVPVLRKDFIIDDYQICEARAAGGDAVLLIVAALDQPQLVDFIQAADALGLDALVEAHTREEVARALAAGARIIGINNRDLNTFSVTLETSLALVKEVPREVIKVSESGIRCREDLAQLRGAGFDAFLIGEQLMRSEDPGQALSQFTLAGQGMK